MVHGDSEINMAGVDPRRFGGHAPGEYTKAKSHQDYEHMYVLHLPGEERPASRGERVTPLFGKLAAKGCVYTEANGWERPKWFSLDGREEEVGFRHNNVFEVVGEECRAVRERVGVLDLSSFAKYDVTGPRAEAYLNTITANRMPRRIGGIVLAHYLSDEGRIVGESTITRLAPDRFYVLSGAGRRGPRPGQPRAGTARRARRHRDQRHRRLGGAGAGGAALARGAREAHRCRARQRALPLADGQGDRGGWDPGSRTAGELRGRTRLGAALSDGASRRSVRCAVDRGEEFGIADFGVYAVNSLRMEKAYKGWGAELTNEITLVEADMERFAAFGKDDFVGKTAMQRVKQAGIATQLVYVEVEPGDCDVHSGEPVIANGKAVGVTTSGAWGHYTGKSLLLRLRRALPSCSGHDVQHRRPRRAARGDGAGRTRVRPRNERLRA